MNRDDHAIVIGLNGYPNLGEPPPSHLKGPARDAAEIASWLRDPMGGGLPAGNVEVITSTDPAADGAYGPLPDHHMLEAAFERLAAKAKANQQNKNAPWIGRRLYIYCSGHGFSPRSGQGSLFAANAGRTMIGANVWLTAWLDTLREGGLFNEYVLWMDCCMDRMGNAPLHGPSATLGVGPGTPGPAFIGFAARRSLRAIERELPEGTGEFRGVFTWNLLAGLRGAAANGYGVVNGRTLADWLRNAQLGLIPPELVNDPRISQEPEIVAHDEAIIFAEGLTPMRFQTVIKVPDDAVGQELLIWSGRPARPSKTPIAAGQVSVSLPVGHYVAEVTGLSLMRGFTVTGEGVVELRSGTPVSEPEVDQLFTLEIANDPPSAGGAPAVDAFLIDEVYVVDEGFRLVTRSAGGLKLQLPFGIYNLKLRSGRRQVQHVVMLDRDLSFTPTGVSSRPPQFLSAAPLPGTAATHEYHEHAVRRAITSAYPVVGAEGQVLLMARTWTGDNARGVPTPWANVRLLDGRGNVVLDLSEEGDRSVDLDPYAVCLKAIAPGAYFLRRGSPEGDDEQTLVVAPGWRTEAYLLRDAGLRHAPRLSILMRRPTAPWGGVDDVRIDQARVALGDERSILSSELDDLLIRKFSNPIAGIIGGHLLVNEQSKLPNDRINLLNELVRNLRDQVGTEHPDVEALSLRCPNTSLHTKKGPPAPPMFEASWRLFVEASYAVPSYAPAAVWKRVRASRLRTPFLVWSPDREAHEAVISALSEAVSRRSAVFETPQHDLGAVGPPAAMASRAAREFTMSLRSTSRQLQLPVSAMRSLARHLK